jgi:hypothetical protein
MKRCEGCDEDEPESRPVKVDRSNGIDVNDKSLPTCLARCDSGNDKSLTVSWKEDLQNGKEESSSSRSSTSEKGRS